MFTVTAKNNSILTTFRRNAIAGLAIAGGLAFSTPAFSACTSCLTANTAKHLNNSLSESMPEVAGKAFEIVAVEPALPLIPSTPIPIVITPDPVVVVVTPPQQTNTDNNIIQGTIAVTQQPGNAPLGAVAGGGNPSINFGDLSPAAGGQTANDPQGLIVATVDPDGSGFLTYAVTDLSIIESLAPAAGGQTGSKEDRKRMMARVYDQLIPMSSFNMADTATVQGPVISRITLPSVKLLGTTPKIPMLRNGCATTRGSASPDKKCVDAAQNIVADAVHSPRQFRL